jgi:hypothetical protein
VRFDAGGLTPDPQAQRVIAVLEDAVERLDFISLIPTTPDPELLDRITGIGDVPLKNATQQQWQVEESQLVMAVGHSPNSAKTSREDISEQLNHVTRALCRHLKRNKDARSIFKRNASAARSPHLVNCQQ